MTELPDLSGFYVAVSAEADESELVADIVYAGRQVAAIRLLDDVWSATFYDAAGAEASSLPLDGLSRAIADAAERLGILPVGSADDER